MTRNVQEIQRKVMPLLRRHGVIRAAVFGSVARGEDHGGSDLDLVVEFEDGRTLLDLSALRQDLQEYLGRETDVVTYAALHHKLRQQILAEQVAIL